MKKRILFVFAPAGPPLDFALQKMTDIAEITTCIFFAPPEYHRGLLDRHSVAVHDFSKLSLEDGLSRLDQMLKEGGFDGVFTFSEFLLMSVTEIARKNGLRSPGANVVRARNKILMRETWGKAGLPQPKFTAIPNRKDARHACLLLKTPFIVKLAYGAGSIGLQVVHDMAEFDRKLDSLLKAAAQARSQGKHEFEESDGFPAIIAEEMIVASTSPWYDTDRYGNFASIEGLVRDGVYKPLAMTARFPTIEPFTELGNIAPSPMESKRKQAVVDVVTRAIDSLELENCATHTEVKLLPDGTISLLETAARMGGVAIARELEVAFDIDYVGLFLKTILGQADDIPDFEATPTGRSAASLALIATDSTGAPWKSKRRFEIDDLNWAELLDGPSNAEVLISQSMPLGSDFPEYDVAGGVMNYAGQLFLQTETPTQMLNSAYSVLDNLERHLPPRAD